MRRTVAWERRALGQIEELSRQRPAEARRIMQVIERFAAEGVGDVRKLKGERDETWRLRSGDWRIRFSLEGDSMVIVAVVLRRDAHE
ncbi:MAG TPA: hypothetical protein PJ994_11165 [Tepidiformaceae bacterium]|nr:hypothetical protein [Tepidiformaceae bacterium]